jgi:phenylacetate-CoA ligase
MTLTAAPISDLVADLIPPAELKPRSIDEVPRLPSFASKMEACERLLQTTYSELDHAVQDLLVLRRLQQITNTAMLNPLWRDRLGSAGLTAAPDSFEAWQQIPLSDKSTQRDYFMGERPGLVVPLRHGGFEIVASGGTSGGLPVETVYSLRELHDTYRIAGGFMGRHLLPAHMTGTDQPRWMFTTLADYQMWSSGTMVGGVLQHIPGVNYVGAGPVQKAVFQHMFSYPGPKALMGISASIALLTELGAGMSQADRDSFRVALYGSGVLSQRKQVELRAMYPNLVILSYFAATQAETIGLQLQPGPAVLASVPGLHLVEVVDAAGRWVAEGEEGELVVTRLHAHDAPLLRFKIEDRMIRRPRLDGPGLRTQQFEFAGRSTDVLHLNDTQYSAPRAYASLCGELQSAGVLDLAALAHEIQFVNHREARTLTLTASVDDVTAASHRIGSMLGPYGLRPLFVNALIRSLSLFNQGEANAGSIDKTGYRFELELVERSSPMIYRTDIGKVPLLRDIF